MRAALLLLAAASALPPAGSTAGSGPPGRPWQTALTLALVAAVAVAGLLAVRRSYNRRP